MSTLPLATLAAQITPAGISAPTIEDIIASDIATYQGIYGSDVLLEADDQDYQLLTIRCTAINDANQLAIAVYNSFFPAFAQGVGLSAVVQINGINREVPTNSTATVTITGVVGTVIQGGIARDQNGNLWNLPTPVTIPISGAIDVTATAQNAGALAATAGTINQLYTIINGWQSVTNAADAVPGAPVESDAALRQRQAKSTALSAITPLDAVLAAVANSGGIGRYRGYENNTNVPDGNGIPRNSIAIVVEGGDLNTIALTIEQKKAPGTGTYGTTVVQVIDQQGLPVMIRFFQLIETPIYVRVNIETFTGYVSTTGTAILNAVVAFIQGLSIGQTVYYNWIVSVASMMGNPLGLTFAVTSITMGTGASSLGSSDIPIPFNAAAQCSPSNVVVSAVLG